jgi:hypothetical protein
MRNQFFVALALITGMAVISSSASTVAAQAQSSGKNAAVEYKVPRTLDGQPDLQGIWANNAATPIERPKELEGRATLSAEEVAALKKRAAELFNGETDAAFGDAVFITALKNAKDYQSRDGVTTDNPKGTGNYNHFWVVDRSFDNRTSLVTDPPDGRIPALTADAQKRQDASVAYVKDHPADGPEDLPLTHRCLTFGVPNLFAGYNSYFQIVQTKDHVAMASEMIHDVRIIPLDSRPHVDSKIRLWMGDSRGHWEGNTLVVETANLNNRTNFLFSKTSGPLENMRLVERFTRVGPGTLKYEVTLTDPTTWTKPWSATLLWARSTGEIYEYACHEGNEGLSGALSGNRAQEKAAVATATRGSK